MVENNYMASNRMPMQKLDNLTESIDGMSEKGADMSPKRIRQPVQVGVDDDGNPIVKWASGRTMQEVIEHGAALMMQYGGMKTPKEANEQGRDFMDCAWEWFDVYHQHKVKFNTALNTKSLMKKHFEPYFGGRSISSITTADIQRFFNERVELSHSTCQKLSIYINQIMDSAVEDGIIQKNPARSKRVTYSKKKTVRGALSQDDALDIFRNLHKLDGLDRILIGIPLLTGCRRSEVLGLMWEDFHWDAGYFHVERALVFKGNAFALTPPKSKAGYRDIPITPELVELLAPYRQDSGYLFTRKDGTFFTQQVFKRAMDRIKKRIDLHGATLHVFRHTFITTAAEHGMDVKTLQSIAGHSDVAITMGVYTHARREKMMMEANRLNGMYGVAN